MSAIGIGLAGSLSRPGRLVSLGPAGSLLVDAFVVRLVLVPAMMTLLGRYGWISPRWADRIAPRLTVEGAARREQPAREE